MKKGDRLLTVLVALLIAIGIFEVSLFAIYGWDLVEGIIGLFTPSSQTETIETTETDNQAGDTSTLGSEPQETTPQEEPNLESNEYVQNGEYTAYPGIPAFPSEIISAAINQNSDEWTYNHDSSNRDADIAEYEAIMEEHGYTEDTMGDGALTFTKDGDELGVVVLLTFDDVVVSIWPA